MLLAELIAPSDTLLDLRAADKPRALKALAERLAVRAGVPASVIESALSAREDLGSTGVGRGIALPHARIPGARLTCAVFARLSKPIDFAAVDGAPVDVICAIVAPDHPRPEALTALAAVSRVLRDAATADQLRTARDRESLYACLTSGDAATASR